ncbi:hypothetical protein Hdeb2414_s0002g00065831 [Helianthus debilis subsp. tardiflorus]
MSPIKQPHPKITCLVGADSCTPIPSCNARFHKTYTHAALSTAAWNNHFHHRRHRHCCRHRTKTAYSMKLYCFDCNLNLQHDDSALVDLVVVVVMAAVGVEVVVPPNLAGQTHLLPQLLPKNHEQSSLRISLVLYFLYFHALFLSTSFLPVLPH